MRLLLQYYQKLVKTMADEEKNNIHRAGLLLGSNLGNKKLHLNSAVKLIEKKIGQVLKKSSVYATAAWGKHNQPDFYNMAVMIQTSLQPEQQLATILSIEKQMGRKRTEKWGPRIIDIDILFIDEKVINVPGLKVPHPHLHERKFVLLPLAEIVPEWFHPQLKKNIKTLIAECKDPLTVEVLR